jgi:hypothetical protein
MFEREGLWRKMRRWELSTRRQPRGFSSGSRSASGSRFRSISTWESTGRSDAVTVAGARGRRGWRPGGDDSWAALGGLDVEEGS